MLNKCIYLVIVPCNKNSPLYSPTHYTFHINLIIMLTTYSNLHKHIKNTTVYNNLRKLKL